MSRLEAGSREESLQRVADTLAELGMKSALHVPLDDRDGLPLAGHRGAPVDERPDDHEPPHLQGGEPARERAGAVRPAAEGRS
jgi:hypothetical protein